MSALFTLIVFLVLFSVLILIHELGHFFTAILSGVKVEEFGLGFPPRAKILTKRKGVIYSLNWIPLGGFVRMLGQDDFSAENTLKNFFAKGSFASQKLWKRMLIIVAGVLMNFLLAYVLLTAVFRVGFYPLAIVPNDRININSYLIMREDFAKQEGVLVFREDLATNPGVRIVEVLKDSLAEKMAFQKDDLIQQINSVDVLEPADVIKMTAESADKKLIFSIKREEKGFKITLTPKQGELVGLGMKANYEITKKQFKWSAPLKAGEELIKQGWVTLYLAKDLVKGVVTKFQISKNIAGPVGMAQLTYDFVGQGITQLLLFAALLSLSLGIMNILPFPALDGGRFLFLLIEAITRKRPDPRIENYLHRLGFILLLALLIIVTWNDVMRFFN